MFKKMKEMKKDDPEQYAFTCAYLTAAAVTVVTVASAVFGGVKLVSYVQNRNAEA